MLAAALLLHNFKVATHERLYAGGFRIDVTVQAQVQGVELTQSDGQLDLVWGGKKIASVNLHGALESFAELVAAAGATNDKLKEALSGAVPILGGTITTSTTDGISVTVSSHGVTTTIGFKFPDHYYISTEVSDPLTEAPVPVIIKSTVEFTPEETAKGKPQEKTKPTTTLEREVTPEGQQAYKPVLPIGDTISIGPSVGGGGVVVLGNGTVSSGTGERARDAVTGIAAAVNHGDVSIGAKVTG